MYNLITNGHTLIETPVLNPNAVIYWQSEVAIFFIL